MNAKIQEILTEVLRSKKQKQAEATFEAIRVEELATLLKGYDNARQ